MHYFTNKYIHKIIQTNSPYNITYSYILKIYMYRFMLNWDFKFNLILLL